MTDKEKIRAYVKRLQKPEGYGDYWKGYDSALNDILSFIDSLPEEPVSEELEEAAKEYAIEQVLCSTDTRMTEQAYLGIRLFNGYDLACAYKDGAENQREQMMKQAVDGEVGYWNLHGLSVNVKLPHSVEEGDKVKVIVIKEDLV